MRTEMPILLKGMFTWKSQLVIQTVNTIQGKYNKVQYQASIVIRHLGIHRPMSMKVNCVNNSGSVC